MKNLSSATKLCYQPNVSSPIYYRILQNLERIYFVRSVIPIQNTSYQTTQPVQYLNMNFNNAVCMYFLYLDCTAIKLMLLYHIIIKGQQKYACKLDKLSSSNISYLHSSVRNFM